MLWGASGALMSGTFEALLYDELVDGRRRLRLRPAGRVDGVGATSLATLAGTAVGGGLLALGGHRLVGWASVAMAVLHVVAVLGLPGAAKVAPSDGRGGGPRSLR